MSEVLYHAIYDNGIGLSEYVVEKEVTPQEISIITYEQKNGQRIETSRIRYRNIGEEYESPFLSWYNLIFCSNEYGPAPDYEYMHRAVQEGKKTAATVYLDPHSSKGKQLVKQLPHDCAAFSYGETMIYVYRRGKLSKFFNFDRIRSIYERHGVTSVDWETVKMYFEKPLSFFRDENLCGFSLQSGGNREQTVVTGLLLGYPIESTISYII